jgi:signal transduction histidine kinase
MLGFGLVVAIIGLLLVGTYKGWSSYRATNRIIESKLAEIEEAQKLKAAAKALQDSPPNLQADATALRQKLALIREALAEYQKKLNETITHGDDPEQGYKEGHQVNALEEKIALVEKAINEAEAPLSSNGPRPPILEQPEVKDAIKALIHVSDDLNSTIYETLRQRMTNAKKDGKISLVIVLSTSVIGVLLMASLLRFFYRWVFYPVRDLEEGAGRLARGNFEHRIEVHSGDEMEDLAAAFNDMTGRLREMYRDLEHQVNERSRQLVRSERLASVGFLAAGVAHEINNPLASIAFCSEALERRLGDVLTTKATPGRLQPEDREVVAKYLKMIQEEAFRCKEITERLLEFSRGGERRREPQELGALVQSVIAISQHLPTGRNKDIVFQGAGEVTAWVNADEIKQVVLNLVVNALDSMDEGGKLTITLRAKDREQGMPSPGGEVAELTFADTGCGMPPEVLENIFEPFFTRSRTGKGTGLGLSISHRIITQHGGEIEAVSPGSGQGSTFTVRIPLQPPETAHEELPLAA